MRQDGGIGLGVEGDEAVEKLGPCELIRVWSSASGEVEASLVRPRCGVDNFRVLGPIASSLLNLLPLGFLGGGLTSSSDSESSSEMATVRRTSRWPARSFSKAMMDASSTVGVAMGAAVLAFLPLLLVFFGGGL